MVVLKTQELAGIDVVADGELNRFDPSHPETNGMIDYFVSRMDGIRTRVLRSPTSRSSARMPGWRTAPSRPASSTAESARARSTCPRDFEFTRGLTAQAAEVHPAPARTCSPRC